jgi:four helix bundle protein
MAQVNSFRDLKVWQEARILATEVYKIAAIFPSDERFGLISQLQRAAVPVASNIAEGHGRRQTQAFINHLSIARGSVAEVETQLIIACDLGYADSDKIAPLLSQADEISRMITGLQRSLQNRRDAQSLELFLDPPPHSSCAS